MDKSKPFGLVLPKKSQAFHPKTSAIFGSDSDDDSGTTKKSSKIPQSKSISSITMKKEELEDPNIYEYDSIYDDMKAKQIAEIAPKEKKSSRYIDHLLKASEKRKKEYERRVERKVQVEREKEGSKYEDKEMFVTSTYKKKLQEREEEEERERRENMLNDMMDVTKQKDLSGFYRHFLKQTVGEEKVPVVGEKFQEISVKAEPQSDSEELQTHVKVEEKSQKLDILPEDRDYSDSDDSSSGEESGEEVQNSYEKSQRVREYRKRPNQESSEDEVGEEVKSSDTLPKKLRIENIEEPTDECESLQLSKEQSKDKFADISNAFEHSVQRSEKNSTETIEKYSKKSRSSNSAKNTISKILENKNKLSPKVSRNRKKDSDSSDISDSSVDDDKSSEEPDLMLNSLNDVKEQANCENKRPKNIYEKRTIGDKFTAAQARFFERLAARSS